MVTPVYAGQKITIEGEFRLLGNPEDPIVIQLRYKSPNGSTITLSYPSADLRRVSQGFYEGFVTVDLPGSWWFRWIGAGVVEAVNEQFLEVLPSNV